MFRDPAAPGSLQFCLARAVGRSRGCGVCLEPTSQPCSLVPPWPSPKLPDAARRPCCARCSCVTSPPAPACARLIRWRLQRHVLAPGAAEAHLRVRAPEPGSAPVQAVLCPRPSAAGAGTREEGARGSAYLPLLTDKSRSVQRLARACLAADPGKPGAARSTPSRASAAKLAELAQRKALSTAAGPARLARRPPRRSSRPSGPAQRSARGGRGSAGSGDARALACSRRGGASHSHPASCSSDVLIYCNCLRRDLGAGPGGGGGAEEGAGGKSLQPPPGPSYSMEPGGQRRGHRSRAPAACAPGWHRGGRSPGPAGAGWGRRGAGPGRVRGVGDPEGVEEPPPADTRARSWRRRWKEPPAAAACARGYTAARPRGLWAAGGAAPPGNLLSPPWSRLWSSWRVGDPAFSPGRGRWGPLEMAVCCATWLSPVWL